jgi:hypothetical protein
MADAYATLRQYDHILFLVVFGCLVASVALAVRRRKAKGLPISDEFPDSPLFLEKWTSGRSLGGLLARAHARNCLYVAVTPRDLLVRPHFPFMLFMPPDSGLELSVSRDKIERVTLQKGERILLEFKSGAGLRNIELDLRQPTKFRNALDG